MYLIEVKKAGSDNFEPVDVVECNDFMTAHDDARSSYAGTSNVVIVRRAGSPESITSLAKHDLQICYGGQICRHGKRGPHLFKMIMDPIKASEILNQ